MKLFTAFHLLINYGGEIHSTFGPSMLPTINTAGDWCIVDKWRYRLGRNLRVGDLVVASKPGGDDIFVLKRVIGMPGDIVLKDPSESKREFIKVPVGHMWIAGDNLSHSVDSRHYGPVPLALVRGRALGTIGLDGLLPRVGWFDSQMGPVHRSAVAVGRVDRLP